MIPKPPAAWPKEPEYAGGILAFFEARWAKSAEGHPEIHIKPMVPRQATGFDWERWALRTLASPDSKRTAKLSDHALPRRPVRESEKPEKAEQTDCTERRDRASVDNRTSATRRR